MPTIPAQDSLRTPAYMTMREVAKVMRFSRNSDALAELQKRGAVLYRIGRRWMIDRAEQDRVLAACAVKP